jgi:hypothetical protein
MLHEALKVGIPLSFVAVNTAWLGSFTSRKSHVVSLSDDALPNRGQLPSWVCMAAKNARSGEMRFSQLRLEIIP